MGRRRRSRTTRRTRRTRRTLRPRHIRRNKQTRCLRRTHLNERVHLEKSERALVRINNPPGLLHGSDDLRVGDTRVAERHRHELDTTAATKEIIRSNLKSHQERLDILDTRVDSHTRTLAAITTEAAHSKMATRPIVYDEAVCLDATQGIYGRATYGRSDEEILQGRDVIINTRLSGRLRTFNLGKTFTAADASWRLDTPSF